MSVVIPVYNVERYLARCLDSVLTAADRLSSSVPDASAEIICVNDGSTDGSAAVLGRYADRVRVVTKPNGGLGSARNAGLDAATGDHVLFVDSDDWIPAHAIAAFASVARESGAALVVSTSYLKDAAAVAPCAPSWRMRRSPWIAGRKVQYCAWNKLYRADLFRNRRYPATIYEDFPVTTDILCEVGEFAAVDAPLYVYCTNSGAVSLVRSSYTPRKLDDSVEVVRQVLATARRQRDREFARFALRQAADGHSSTVGQVWKSHDAELRARFVAEHARLISDYPELAGGLSLKARIRLWRMKGA